MPIFFGAHFFPNYVRGHIKIREKNRQLAEFRHWQTEQLSKFSALYMFYSLCLIARAMDHEHIERKVDSAWHSNGHDHISSHVHLSMILAFPLRIFTWSVQFNLGECVCVWLAIVWYLVGAKLYSARCLSMLMIFERAPRLLKLFDLITKLAIVPYSHLAMRIDVRFIYSHRFITRWKAKNI